MPRGTTRHQEAPGSPRGPQEAPEGSRKPQEVPGGPRRPQEAPGGTRKHQEAAGTPTRLQKAPGSHRTHQEAPGGPRKPEGASGGSRNPQEAPGNLRKSEEAPAGRGSLGRAAVAWYAAGVLWAGCQWLWRCPLAQCGRHRVLGGVRPSPPEEAPAGRCPRGSRECRRKTKSKNSSNFFIVQNNV